MNRLLIVALLLVPRMLFAANTMQWNGTNMSWNGTVMDWQVTYSVTTTDTTLPMDFGTTTHAGSGPLMTWNNVNMQWNGVTMRWATFTSYTVAVQENLTTRATHNLGRSVTTVDAMTVRDAPKFSGPVMTWNGVDMQWNGSNMLWPRLSWQASAVEWTQMREKSLQLGITVTAQEGAVGYGSTTRDVGYHPLAYHVAVSEVLAVSDAAVRGGPVMLWNSITMTWNSTSMIWPRASRSAIVSEFIGTYEKQIQLGASVQATEGFPTWGSPTRDTGGPTPTVSARVTEWLRVTDVPVGTLHHLSPNYMTWANVTMQWNNVSMYWGSAILPDKTAIGVENLSVWEAQGSAIGHLTSRIAVDYVLAVEKQLNINANVIPNEGFPTWAPTTRDVVSYVQSTSGNVRFAVDYVGFAERPTTLAAHYGSPVEQLVTLASAARIGSHFGSGTELLRVWEAQGIAHPVLRSVLDMTSLMDVGSGLSAHYMTATDYRPVMDSPRGIAGHVATPVEYALAWDANFGLRALIRLVTEPLVTRAVHTSIGSHSGLGMEFLPLNEFAGYHGGFLRVVTAFERVPLSEVGIPTAGKHISTFDALQVFDWNASSAAHIATPVEFVYTWDAVNGQFRVSIKQRVVIIN